MVNFFREALICYKQGKYSGALHFFLLAVEQNPENHKALNAAAICQSRMGNFNDAIHSLENALLIDPDNVSYQKNLEKIQLKKGQSTNEQDKLKEDESKKEPKPVLEKESIQENEPNSSFTGFILKAIVFLFILCITSGFIASFIYGIDSHSYSESTSITKQNSPSQQLNTPTIQSNDKPNTKSISEQSYQEKMSIHTTTTLTQVPISIQTQSSAIPKTTLSELEDGDHRGDSVQPTATISKSKNSLSTILTNNGGWITKFEDSTEQGIFLDPEQTVRIYITRDPAKPILDGRTFERFITDTRFAYSVQKYSSSTDLVDYKVNTFEVDGEKAYQFVLETTSGLIWDIYFIDGNEFVQIIYSAPESKFEAYSTDALLKIKDYLSGL
jgi:hypothetical protein